jgi:hypothetical protein
MEASTTGLPSILYGSCGKMCDKLMNEMEPKVTTKKRKCVSFANSKEKVSKTTPTIVSPSPSQYRTRAVVREEAHGSPMKSDKCWHLSGNEMQMMQVLQIA